MKTKKKLSALPAPLKQKKLMLLLGALTTGGLAWFLLRKKSTATNTATTSKPAATASSTPAPASTAATNPASAASGIMPPDGFIITDFDGVYNYKYQGGVWWTIKKTDANNTGIAGPAWTNMKTALSAANYTTAVNKLMDYYQGN